MAKHPVQNANVNYDDDQQAHVLVNIVDTSVSNNTRFPMDFETHDVAETFSDTNVHEYFQFQHSSAGGPPGVLSIFDGAVSVLSRGCCLPRVSEYSRFRQTNRKK